MLDGKWMHSFRENGDGLPKAIWDFPAQPALETVKDWPRHQSPYGAHYTARLRGPFWVRCSLWFRAIFPTRFFGVVALPGFQVGAPARESCAYRWAMRRYFQIVHYATINSQMCIPFIIFRISLSTLKWACYVAMTRTYYNMYNNNITAGASLPHPRSSLHHLSRTKSLEYV